MQSVFYPPPPPPKRSQRRKPEPRTSEPQFLARPPPHPTHPILRGLNGFRAPVNGGGVQRHESHHSSLMFIIYFRITSTGVDTCSSCYSSTATVGVLWKCICFRIRVAGSRFDFAECSRHAYFGNVWEECSVLGFGVPYFNTFFLKGTIMK